MANTVVTALVGALLFCSRWCRCSRRSCCRKPEPPPRLAAAALARRRVYEPTLRWALRHGAAGAGRQRAGARRGACVALSRLGSEFLPELNEGALYSPSRCRRTSPQRGAAAGAAHHRDPRSATPRSTSVLSQLGRPEDGTDPTLPNNLEFFVKLKPLEHWRRGRRTLDDVDRRDSTAAWRRSPASRSTSRSRSATT